MDKFLEEYLSECSKVCNIRGYTGLCENFQRIREKLSLGNGLETIDSYIQETKHHCDEITQNGGRIFGWDDIKPELLELRLRKLNNLPPKA